MEGSGFSSFSGEVLRAPELTLLGDGAQTVDLLGYQPYVDALVEVLAQKDLQTPFAVGVFGRWGTGKSTFMNLLRESLSIEARLARNESGGFHSVLFQPWQFEEKEEVWKALLLSVIRYLEAVEARRKTPAGQDAERIKGTLRNLALSVGKLALDKTIQTMTSDTVNLDKVLQAYAETARDNANFINTFRKQFADLKKEILGSDSRKVPRLFIFVDDLDRCTPDNCIMVLEAIKLFFDLQECVFILGIDREVVQRGIEQKYNNSIGIHGQDYLDKLIQLPFSLPPIRPETFERFVEAITRDFAFADEVQKLIVRAAESNPRLAKRLSNCLQLTRTVARRLSDTAEDGSPLEGEKFDGAKFALLLTLQVRYPVAYLWLTRNPLTRSELTEGWEDRSSESAAGAVIGYRSRLVAFLKDAYGDSIAEQNADGFLALWRYAESKDIGVAPFRDLDELEFYMRITGVVEEGRAWDFAKRQPPTADSVHDTAYSAPAERDGSKPDDRLSQVGPGPGGRVPDTADEDQSSQKLLRRAEAVRIRWKNFEKRGVLWAPVILPRIMWRVGRLLDDAEKTSADITARLREDDVHPDNIAKLQDKRKDLRHIEPLRAYRHVGSVASAFLFVWLISLAVIGWSLELLLATVLPLSPDLYAMLFGGTTGEDVTASVSPLTAVIGAIRALPWAFPGGAIFFWAAVVYAVLALVIWSRSRHQIAQIEKRLKESTDTSSA